MHPHLLAQKRASDQSLVMFFFGFVFKRRVATIAPEASLFQVSRDGWQKKKKRHLLLGFRCCWPE